MHKISWQGPILNNCSGVSFAGH